MRRLATQLPAVIVTGPRQAGKTTLCRLAWPDHDYVNLQRPDLREFAASDRQGLLDSHPHGAILDEIQRVPELTSWLQVRIDRDPTPSRWILTGSEQLTLTGRTSQSLAGRAAAAHLLPFDVQELAQAHELVRSKSGPGWLGAARRGATWPPAPIPWSSNPGWGATCRATWSGTCAACLPSGTWPASRTSSASPRPGPPRP